MEFDDFFSGNSKYKKFLTSKSARDIFRFLSKPENIQKMIDANDRGKPALYGCLKDLEQNFSSCADFDFNEGFVKQCVGAMVKFILEPFGYSPALQKDMPKGKYKFFTSGTNYRFNGDKAFLKLVQEIKVEKIKETLYVPRPDIREKKE